MPDVYFVFENGSAFYRKLLLKLLFVAFLTG